MDYMEFTGKTVDDAITEACQKFTITSDRLEYEVIEKGTGGIFGFAAKPAIIKARVFDPNAPKEEKKEEPVKSEEAVLEKQTADQAEDVPAADPKEFLGKIFDAMNMKVEVSVNSHDNEMDIDLSGDDMGVLIGKRGQTLDSLQYLTSIVVNKGRKEYIRVKVDTENYRSRRKETLENLAKNLAYKAKRTKNPVSLEPMNPYERRIIHSALQNDKYVTTHSEGEDPFRKVIITPVK
ncbi:MAG: protein jag [Lachnospiraceae bacterium]|nr:protein jag [Lachnospiraceae bacterium]